MLRLPEFTYLAPRTAEEAAAALSQYGPAAMVVAGGTDLVPNLKRRQFPVQVLVGLHNIPGLRGIHLDASAGVVIGALTPLAAVAAHSQVRMSYQALAEAAAAVASPLIRSSATLGGNLLVDTRCNYYNQSEEWRDALGRCMKCDPTTPCRVAPSSPRCLAVSASDTAPALIALGARLRLTGSDGSREVPLAEFYREDGIHYTLRREGEILTEILLPPAAGLASTYLKLRRRGSIDFPILGVAAALRRRPDGSVDACRLVLGAVASAPLLISEAADLAGRPLDEAAIGALAKAAARRARPVDNADLVIPYRKRMTQGFTARALRAGAGLS